MPTSRRKLVTRRDRAANKIRSRTRNCFSAALAFVLGSAAAETVKKYWHVINIGIQNNLTYRFNFLFRTLFGFMPLLATIYLWRTIYRPQPAGDTVADYTLAQMISYYLIVTIVDALTAVNEDDWQIAADIKDGNISQFLLKPIDYLTYRLCLFFSGRVIYMIVAALPLGMFIFCLRQYFVLPPDPTALGWFLVSRDADGAAAIFHVLHHGDAGVLGAGGFHLHLHPVRL